MARLARVLTLLTFAMTASVAGAYPRVPQVPVAGSALASFLASQGQAIDPATQQQDMQAFSFVNVGMPVTVGFVVRARLGSASLCVYNAGVPGSPLYTVFPGSATPGWYTWVTFRTGPDRLVVNLFDAADVLVGTTTYLGVAFHAGLATVSPAGTRYSEDALNPGGAPRLLFFGGTGPLTGSAWLCAEDQDAPGGDFADQVFLLEYFGTVRSERASWARIKQLFR